MATMNVFGERICDKTCPAYSGGDVFGELCNAKLDYIGRIKSVDGKAQNGMLCKLPVDFKVVVNEG
jgi:hypothetical protein